MFEHVSIMEWIVIGLGLLLFISEALPFNAKIKANGIFQAVVNGAKAIKDFLAKK